MNPTTPPKDTSSDLPTLKNLHAFLERYKPIFEEGDTALRQNELWRLWCVAVARSLHVNYVDFTSADVDTQYAELRQRISAHLSIPMLENTKADAPLQLTIHSVDHAPEWLYDVLPITLDLVRMMPGPDRDDYWLGCLHKATNSDRSYFEDTNITHMLVTSRWAGVTLHAGADNIPINIGLVINNSLLKDDKLVSKKYVSLAIGIASVTLSAAHSQQEVSPERTDGGCTPVVPDDSPCLPNEEVDNTSIFRMSYEWAQETNIVVLALEGWKDKAYTDKITKTEFLRRCVHSRCKWPSKAMLDSALDAEYPLHQPRSTISTPVAAQAPVIPDKTKQVYSCTNCKFFYNATCRRNTPTIVSNINTISSDPLRIFSAASTVWPEVSTNDWCGEFKQAP